MTSSTPYAPGTTLLLVGTKRGLFILSSRDRHGWEMVSTTFPAHRVYNATLDQRHPTAPPRLLAADNGDFFGTFMRYSDDFGQTWQESERGIQFPEDSGLSLQNIWTIEPGRASEPETLYAGVDPASLWISHDRGATWDLNDGLAQHPTREHWNPGAGGLCLHTIVPDYANPDRMWVGISAVGCMRTDDGGKSWQHLNQHVRQDFGPELYPEYGQCLHRMVQHPTQPDVLYQQNHCGIYKSTDAGDDWTDIQHNLPSPFGFPITLDPHHPDTVFTIVENDARNNVGEQFSIYRTRDGGEQWEALTEGLPSGEGVRLGVLRHGMCSDEHDPCGIYVGTNTGQVFASTNGGDSWHLIADFLPSVYSVRAVVVA